MAKRTQIITELSDDLDGSEGSQTIAFVWRGTSYEIDLSDKNAAKFEKAMSLYVDHARKAGERPADRRTRGSRAGGAAAGGHDTAAIRSWAKEQGVAVNERGRLSRELVAQFEAAH